MEELFSLAESIHQVLKSEIVDDVSVYTERGNSLAVYMANTGKMLADARYWRDQALSESIIKKIKTTLPLPASTLNELVKAECKNENYLVNWIEQLDKETKYQLEWLRTCISKEKAQMYLMGNQAG